MTDSNSPLLVRDLMTVGVKTCPPDTPIRDIARLLLNKDLEAVVILDDEGHGIGIVGWDELAAAYGRGDWDDQIAQDAMREDVPTLPPDIPLTAAADLMRDMKTRIVFLNHNAGGIIYPAAMLSWRHLLRHLAAQTDEELADLGILARRESPIETFKRRRDEALKAARRMND